MGVIYLCIQISLLEKHVNIAAGTPNRSVQLVSSWIYKVVGCRFSLYSGFFSCWFLCIQILCLWLSFTICYLIALVHYLLLSCHTRGRGSESPLLHGAYGQNFSLLGELSIDS